MDRALGGARHGGWLGAWGRLSCRPIAWPPPPVALAAAGVCRLGARPLPRSEPAARAALRGAAECVASELGRLPAGPRRGHGGRRADCPALAVEPDARAGIPCGTGAGRTTGRARAATRTA